MCFAPSNAVSCSANLTSSASSGRAAPADSIQRLQTVVKGTGTQADSLCLLDERGRVINHPNPAMIGMPWGKMEMTRLDTGQSMPMEHALKDRQPVSGLQREPVPSENKPSP